MVLLSRLELVQAQLREGHLVLVQFLPNTFNGRLKIKITIKPDRATLHDDVVAPILTALDMIASFAASLQAVDRGHKHSDGTMDICIWFSPREKAAVDNDCAELSDKITRITTSIDDSFRSLVSIAAASTMELERSLDAAQKRYDEHMSSQVHSDEDKTQGDAALEQMFSSVRQEHAQTPNSNVSRTLASITGMVLQRRDFESLLQTHSHHRQTSSMQVTAGSAGDSLH